MLVFVDLEHASAHGLEHGQRMLAARTWLTYRLEDLSDMHCHLVRYDRIEPALLDRVAASALFVSGNSLALDDYEPAELEPLEEIVRETSLPVFGFCGGFQLVARALGVDVVALPDDAARRADPTVTVTDDGTLFEHGYHPVELVGERSDHPLLGGIDERVFRHAHGLHVPDLPDGFTRLASTAATDNQMAVDDDRRIVGTQFHPEYWTDDHPDGRTLIVNFLRWADVVDV